MTDSIIYNMVRARWLLLMLLTVTLASCTADGDDTSTAEADVLRLSAYMPAMTEDGDSPAATRADLPGYYQYNGPNTIAVYPATSDAEETLPASMFYYEEDEWHSTVNVKLSKEYYLYGFMPADIPASYSIKAVDNDYSKGAVITFSQLSPVSASDFCVLTGVQDVNDSADPADTPDIKSGAFTYQGKAKGSNYVNLKFQHAYAGIRFLVRVGEAYSKLRTIKLREMTLRTTSIYSVSWAFQFNPGSETAPVSFIGADVTPLAGSPAVTLFTTGEDEGTPLATETPVEIFGYYFPVTYQAYIGRQLQISCRYDVYDTKNNPIRQGCVATNNLPDLSTPQGSMKTLNLTVEPTYLYVLSDPDLNDPVVKVE